jgi:putative flippase GtrA
MSADEATHEHVLPLVEHGRHRVTGHAIKLGQFAVVGGVGYLINLCIFAIVHDRLAVGYVAASALAFLVAVCGNYVGNRTWTFREHQGHVVHQGLRSIACATLTFAIQLGILRFLVESLSVEALYAQAIAVAVCLPINFILQRRLVFHDFSSARPER